MIKNNSQTKRYQTSFKAPSPNWVRKNISMPKLRNLDASEMRRLQNGFITHQSVASAPPPPVKRIEINAKR